MTFDEQLQRAFDTLTDRLRGEIAQHLRTAADELAASVESERAAAAAQAANDARGAAEREAAARLSEAVAAAEARGRETGKQEGTQDGRAAGRREGLEEGRQKGLEEGRQEARADLRSTERAASERLVDAIRSIDRARSLSEILDTLASCAGREAARVGVLLVQRSRLRGWRFIGFGPALDAAAQIELPLAEAGIIAETVRTGITSADTTGHCAAPSFAELPPGREILAVPVPMSGRVVAVLYADHGPADVGDRDVRVAWPETLEVMARHAARCLEALTAFRAAQVLTERPEEPAPSIEHDAGASQSSRPDDQADEDQAARRYARLLISEIKLYHETAVIAGRRQRDLATRLGDEIARARVLYEQRVPAHVRRGADHFHAELVRTLANGDATLLGQTT